MAIQFFFFFFLPASLTHFFGPFGPKGTKSGGRKGVSEARFLGESLRSPLFEGESGINISFRPLRGLKLPRSPYGDRIWVFFLNFNLEKICL